MDKYYFANTVDDIFDKISGTKCPMCENVVLESNSILKRHFDSRHFRHAIFYEIDGKQACILPCRKECGLHRRSHSEGKRAHFHCPFCHQMYGRSTSFRHHLMKTQGNCSKGVATKSGFGKNGVEHNIMFVQEVQKYEELYNPQAEGFNNKDEQNLAWTAISHAMDEDETSCIARWKRLRAIYYQYLKSAVNSSRHTPKHYLSDHMEFMRPYMKNVKVKVKQEPQPTIEIMTDLPPDSILEADVGQEMKSYQTSCSVPDQNRIKKREHSSYFSDEHYSREDTLCKRRHSNHSETDDVDMAFFRSLLPDMQRMDHRQKSRFKRITLGIIEDILYSNSMTK